MDDGKAFKVQNFPARIRIPIAMKAIAAARLIQTSGK
jgi:hypothetical protein